jgi:hypothetical protein
MDAFLVNAAGWIAFLDVGIYSATVNGIAAATDAESEAKDITGRSVMVGEQAKDVCDLFDPWIIEGFRGYDQAATSDAFRRNMQCRTNIALAENAFRLRTLRRQAAASAPVAFLAKAGFGEDGEEAHATCNSTACFFWS